MKTVLALTTAIFAIVYFNCGNNETNTGQYYPQNSSSASVTDLYPANPDSVGIYR